VTSAPDEADRLKAGKLSPDPAAGTERMRGQPRGASYPPDVAQERALLGALLWAGTNAPEALRVEMVLDLLRGGETMGDARHADIVRAMVDCHAQGAHHEPVAVHAQMVASGRGWDLGKLRGLLDDATTVSEAQARAYAHGIRDAWSRRKIVACSAEIATMARNPKMPPGEALASALSKLAEVGGDLSASGHFVSAKDAFTEYFERVRAAQSACWSTGLRDLDQEVVGLFPNEVSVLAARTSVGKSALAAGIAMGIAERSENAVVLYVSLEMKASLFCGRLAAARAGIPARALRRVGRPDGTLSKEQWGALTAAVGEITQLGLFFADSTQQTIASIASMCDELVRKLAREGKVLALIVVDHVGLVIPSSEALKRDSRERQVAEVSRHLRRLAERFGCHVMALAQINRQSESQKSESRIPQLHHLAESDAIGRDADMVLILHRDKDKQSGVLDTTKPAALIVAKARNDSQGPLLVEFDPVHVAFRDYDGEETFARVYGGPNG